MNLNEDYDSLTRERTSFLNRMDGFGRGKESTDAAQNFYDGLTSAERDMANSKDFEDAIKEREKALGHVITSVYEYNKILDDMQKNEDNKTGTFSFSEAWKSLDNTEDSDLKDTKQNVLELAKAGQLTEETFNKVKGAKKWAKSINDPIDSVIKKINSYVTSSDQLSAMSEGISALTENLYNKTKNKKVKFIDSETLSKMPDELKACRKEWKEYEKIMGDANSETEDAKKVTDALASAYVNNGNYLSNITREKRDSYIAQMESIGITNAEAIADQTLSDNEDALEHKEEAMTIAAEAANGKISDQSQALINNAEMSNKAKIALIDLAAKEIIYNRQDLNTEAMSIQNVTYFIQTRLHRILKYILNIPKAVHPFVYKIHRQMHIVTCTDCTCKTNTGKEWYYKCN